MERYSKLKCVDCKALFRKLSQLTPQGSEFIEFDECYDYIKKQLDERHEALKKIVRLKRRLREWGENV